MKDVLPSLLMKDVSSLVIQPEEHADQKFGWT
jgi:hypothetical protein